LKLPKDKLIIILRDNKLSISELDLFRAVLSWGKAECKREDKKEEELPEVLKDVIHHIRFPLMQVQDIATEVSNSKVLDQKNNIIPVLLSCYS